MRVRLFAVLGILAAALVSLFVLFHRDAQEVKWRVVLGTIRDVRISPDHKIESLFGGKMIWRGEYRVVYAVAGREYSVWADSGIRDDSQAVIQLKLAKAHVSCSVRYNPTKPEMAVADCQ